MSSARWPSGWCATGSRPWSSWCGPRASRKRTTARFLAFGVNGLAVALMVVVFVSTAGMTGAEVGIAGGSAVLGQKLLEAVFGDQAVRRLTELSRRDLEDRVAAAYDVELARWDDVLVGLGVDAEERRAAGRGRRAPSRPRPGTGVSLAAGVKRLTGRGPDLPARLAALREAVEATEGRLDPDLLARAGSVLERAEGRLALAGDHTVVALAGATGSGKSSLFNALAGSSLSQVGVRRPTTSVDDRRRLGRGRRGARLAAGAAAPPGRDGPATPAGSAGWCCSTCPTTTPPRSPTTSRWTGWSRWSTCWCSSSTRRSTPTPRSTTATSRRCRPTARSCWWCSTTSTRSPPDRRRDLDRDLARLLDADGLTGVPRLQTSAVTGEGVDALRDVLAERVAATRAAAARLSADVAAVAGAMREANGDGDERRGTEGRGRHRRPARRAGLGAGRVGRRAHGGAGRGALDGASRIAAHRMAGAGLAGPAATRPAAPAPPRPAAGTVRRTATRGASRSVPTGPRCRRRAGSSGPGPRPPCAGSPTRWGSR